ncbi:MAG: hypothetical protein AAGD11_16140 [Planctomycetota bacterium]
MKRTIVFAVALFAISSNWSAAQESDPRAEPNRDAADGEWYYSTSGKQPETKPLGRLRSEQRARQRLTRMESMRWYGFSASRPTASGMPFTTMYAPAWTRPGGRPFSWYTTQRPVVLVSPYYPGYY